MNVNTNPVINLVEENSTPEPAQSEHRLNATASAAGVTADGADWLSYVLDPFKDSERDAKGFPDMVQSRSVIQIIPQTISLAVPTGVSTNWDCLITMSPQVSSVSMLNFPAGPSNNILNTNYAAPATRTFGGLEVRSAASGTNLTPLTQVSNVPLPASYLPLGNVRVIGMAMEIHNTTADINKQGSVCVFRDQSPSVDSSFAGMYATIGALNAVTSNSGAVELQQLPTVPETLAAARLLGNAKQWEAEKGAYIVATLNNDRNRPYSADTLETMPIMFSESGAVWSIPNATSSLYTAGPSISYPNPTNPPLFTPFNLSGAFFTGLSNASTLQADIKWILEKFPNHDNVVLVPLAKKSPMFDPLALEMYARIADSLPAGVPVCENGAGEWIETIADLAADVGIPFAGMVSKGVKMFKPAINALTTGWSDSEKMYEDRPQKNKKLRLVKANPNANKNVKNTVNSNNKQQFSRQLGLVASHNKPFKAGEPPVQLKFANPWESKNSSQRNKSLRSSTTVPKLTVYNSNKKT
jgi:hypothetical protein